MEAKDFIGKTVLVHSGAHLMVTGSVTGIYFLGMIDPSQRLPHYDIEITENMKIEGDVVCNELHCMGMVTAWAG